MAPRMTANTIAQSYDVPSNHCRQMLRNMKFALQTTAEDYMESTGTVIDTWLAESFLDEAWTGADDEYIYELAFLASEWYQPTN